MSNINQIEKEGIVYNVEDVNAQRKTLIVTSSSYVTLDDSMSTIVPDLTTQQVTDIYNAITIGKEVYIEDYLEDNRVLVNQKSPIDGNIHIYFSYLSRLELTYSIVEDEVKIDYIELNKEIEIKTDNTTVSKNSDDELQAIGLTDGSDGLTFQEIYQALTIRRHS